MKKTLICVSAVILVIALLFCFAACTKNDSTYESDYATSRLESSSAPYRKAASGGSSVQKVILTTDRMMVYTVDIALTVTDYAETASSIRGALAEAGGYEQSSSTSSGGRYTFTLRVPTEKLNAFLHAVGESGTVESQEISGEDITDRYLSAEQERDALIAKKAALEALAEEATTFTDKVTIYEKIPDVAAEIDRYNDRLSDYKKSSDYSTVYITLYEQGTYEEPSFWQNLGATFLGSGKSIGALFGWILKAIVAVVPYAVLLGVIFGIFCLIRLIVCRRKGVPFYLFRSKEARASRKERANAALKSLTQKDEEANPAKENEGEPPAKNQ